jgi:hypothetical protein
MSTFLQAPNASITSINGPSGTTYTVSGGLIDATLASAADVAALTGAGFTAFSPPALPSIQASAPTSGVTGTGARITIGATETVLAAGQTYSVRGGAGPAVTTDGSTQVTIFSFTTPANTGTDWSVSLMGLDVTGAPPISGDFYRADLTFSTTRIGTAAPVLTPTTPAAANPQNSGGGSTYAVQAVISGNAVLVQVKGATNKTVHWSGAYQCTAVG